MESSQLAIDQMREAFDKGLFKQGMNGEIEAVDNPAEREHLASTIKKDREEQARRE